MPAGNNASAIAAQKEAINPEMPHLMLEASYFWGRTEVLPMTEVSMRPTRIPTLVSETGAFSVAGIDGQNLGRGTAPQEVPAYASPVAFLQASEWTLESDWATDSSAKAIQNYVTLTHQKSFVTFGGYMDVIAQGDGSNTLDTIVSVVTSGLVVNSVNKFQNGQTVDIFTAVNGALVTSLTILTCDIQSNTIWFSTGIPGGVLAGMPIMVHGSSGQANSGLLGSLYYLTQLNVGNYLGIPRASFPGMYVANGFSLNNQSLTPSAVRAMEVLSLYAMGEENLNSDPIINTGPDMLMAWEAIGLGMSTVTREQATSATGVDALAKGMGRTIAGREVLGPRGMGNPRATPGRLEFEDMRDWKRLEVKPADYISYGGQTEFPIIGSDGGLASATIFYICVVTQLICTVARHQAFISGAAVPKYILGR